MTSSESVDGTVDNLRESTRNSFDAYLWRKTLFIVLCVAGAFIAGVYLLTIGDYPIGFFESFTIVIDHITGNIQDPTKDFIIIERRLPMIIMAVVVGVCLAVAGATMQSVMKNPLADPYTTGISSGASFGASLAIISGITVMTGQWGLVINAFVFSLIPMAAIILISTIRHTSPTTMILAGIAVMYFFDAITTVIRLKADPDALKEVYNWGVGSLGYANWENLPIVITTTAIAVVLMMLLSRVLNVLASGDDSAKSLGVDSDKMRIVSLLIVSFATAAIVSFTGTIGFVGLVCPHIARMFIGSDNRFLIPASAAFGAFLVIVADIVARSITTNLQVGVVLSFIGGPLFLYILMKQRKEVWRWSSASNTWISSTTRTPGSYTTSTSPSMNQGSTASSAPTEWANPHW